MQKEFFDGLYHKIRHIKIRSCDVTGLIALLHLYNNVNSLVSVIPCLGQEYGGHRIIAKRTKTIAGTMVAKMEAEMSVKEEIQCLEALIDYSSRYIDYTWIDQVLERARLLLEKYIPTPGQEADFCQLICDCYYMVQEKELAERAKKIIVQWCLQQTNAGEWPGIDPVTAIKRLFVIDAYQTFTWDLDFDTFRQKGIDCYRNDLPMNGAGLSEEQVDIYFHKAVLLLFINNPRTERKRIEHLGTVLEQYLKESGPHSFKCINDPNKKNKKKLNGKDFSAVTLNCLSILAACLLEQLGWECEERMTSLQFRLESSGI